ncbi:hypothetical protein M0222_06885 [Myxococcus fulvus]|nr:hypothetical protein [Myxococcus fulvus]
MHRRGAEPQPLGHLLLAETRLEQRQDLLEPQGESQGLGAAPQEPQLAVELAPGVYAVKVTDTRPAALARTGVPPRRMT